MNGLIRAALLLLFLGLSFPVSAGSLTDYDLSGEQGTAGPFDIGFTFQVHGVPETRFYIDTRTGELHFDPKAP